MHFRSKKSLGQNFLTDQNILRKIVEVGEISKNDNILEIGPGTANLTKYILETKPKSVTVVEKDAELVETLKITFEAVYNGMATIMPVVPISEPPTRITIKISSG